MCDRRIVLGVQLSLAAVLILGLGALFASPAIYCLCLVLLGIGVAWLLCGALSQ